MIYLAAWFLVSAIVSPLIGAAIHAGTGREPY